MIVRDRQGQPLAPGDLVLVVRAYGWDEFDGRTATVKELHGPGTPLPRGRQTQDYGVLFETPLRSGPATLVGARGSELLKLGNTAPDKARTRDEKLSTT